MHTDNTKDLYRVSFDIYLDSKTGKVYEMVTHKDEALFEEITRTQAVENFREWLRLHQEECG